MVRELNDLGFSLPSEFLTDEDLLTDFESDRLTDFAYVFGNSCGFNSALSSPGELATEAESEDDDLVSELTRQLVHSALLSDYSSSKGWKVAGSPQSTLCGCKTGPTVSPNSVSGFCSPPNEDYLRQDFLYAAAEEVARMRMIEETAAFYSSNHFPPQAKPSPQLSPSPNYGFYQNQARSQAHLPPQLLQAAKMKQQQQQMMKSGDFAEFQLRNGRRNDGDGSGRASMAAWPGLQQAGSGMRAIYLGEPGPKKERTGTGVFLPQRFGSLPAETRKKSVLLPEKVVNALKIDVDAIEAQPHLHRSSSRDYAAYNFDYDAASAALKRRKNLMMAQQRRNLAPQLAMNHQLRLPRDWTY